MFSTKTIQPLNIFWNEPRRRTWRLKKLSERYLSLLNYNTFDSKCFKSSSILEKLISKCHYSTSAVSYLKAGIIRSDNVVVSPYSDVDIPDCLLHEHLWQNLDRFSDHTAIECSVTGRKYTFSQLRDHCRKFAAALLKSGLKPGQVISIVLPNLPEFPIALFGAIEAGMIVSTVNPAYTCNEICHQLKDSNSVCVITFADKLSTIQEAVSTLVHESKQGSSLKIISIQDYDGIPRPCPAGVWLFKEMITNNFDTDVLNSISLEYNINPENNVVLPYSSGTTGLPKGVCLSHRNLVSNSKQTEHYRCRHIMLPNENFQDVLPAVLPFFHIYGLSIILMLSIRSGGKLMTLPKFSPESFLKLLREQKNTILYLVPPILLFIGANKDIKKENLQHVRFVTSGAAPIGASDIERCLHKMPNETCFIQAYGLTETSPLAVIPENKKNNNYATVGNPASLTKIKVVDENNRPLSVNEHGELCIKGPQVMKGYLNRPEATAEVIDEEGWLHTGDVCYYDEGGNVYIVDRKKELIKVKGFQVAPAELEELLRSHPEVADVAVIGVPDPRTGETPIAYVVPKKGSKNEHVSAQKLKDFIADKVASYKQLSDIIFQEFIPKSPSGKILRRVLKTEYLNKMK